MTQPNPVGENEKFWSRVAGKYDGGMRKVKGYDQMVGRVVRDASDARRVIEIATGTGMIALGLAPFVEQIDAFDLAEGMIKVAQEKARATGIANLRFSVGSAYGLDAAERLYDTAILSNALHIMETPELALSEIARVLKDDGRLIAPTFLHGQSIKAQLISRVMSTVSGFKVYHRWDQRGFAELVESCGFRITALEILDLTIPLAYCIAEKR